MKNNFSKETMKSHCRVLSKGINGTGTLLAMCRVEMEAKMGIKIGQ